MDLPTDRADLIYLCALARTIQRSGGLDRDSFDAALRSSLTQISNQLEVSRPMIDDLLELNASFLRFLDLNEQ